MNSRRTWNITTTHQLDRVVPACAVRNDGHLLWLDPSDDFFPDVTNVRCGGQVTLQHRNRSDLIIVRNKDRKNGPRLNLQTRTIRSYSSVTHSNTFLRAVVPVCDDDFVSTFSAFEDVRHHAPVLQVLVDDQAAVEEESQTYLQYLVAQARL